MHARGGTRITTGLVVMGTVAVLIGPLASAWAQDAGAPNSASGGSGSTGAATTQPAPNAGSGAGSAPRVTPSPPRASAPPVQRTPAPAPAPTRAPSSVAPATPARPAAHAKRTPARHRREAPKRHARKPAAHTSPARGTPTSTPVPTAAAADPASQPLAFAPAGGNDRWIILIMLGVVAGLLLRELLSALHVGQRLRRRYF